MLNTVVAPKGLTKATPDSKDKINHHQLLILNENSAKHKQNPHVKPQKKWLHFGGYPLSRAVSQATHAKNPQTDTWLLIHHPLYCSVGTITYNAFILQATQSSCQNSQFPAHLHNQENEANVQTVNKFVGCRKMTTTTLFMDSGLQQPVICLIKKLCLASGRQTDGHYSQSELFE